jgi:hypothetical protein
MAKYYVESGTVQMVTEADDARGAALWTLHRCLEQILPVCPDDPLSAGEKAERIAQRGCWVLGESIRTSEQGFGREDVEQYETAEIFAEWNQLMMAVSDLQRQLRVIC